jgi:hypothetical protein
LVTRRVQRILDGWATVTRNHLEVPLPRPVPRKRSSPKHAIQAVLTYELVGGGGGGCCQVL